MNKLYTGLMALVLSAGGCDNSDDIRRAVDYAVGQERASQATHCQEEKNSLQQGIEQKLKEEVMKEVAKAKGEAQVSCDVRVKEVEARYAAKETAELPQDVTAQFPKMDEPMHELLRGMAQGKYDVVSEWDYTMTDVHDEGDSLPLLYRGYNGTGSFSLSFTQRCAKGMVPVDMPVENTECTVGYALAYNPDANTFQADQWKKAYVKDIDGQYNLETMGVSYVGKGQSLTWDTVNKIEVRTPETGYEPQELATATLDKEVGRMHQTSFEKMLASLYQTSEAEVLRVQKTTVVPMFEAKKGN